MIDALLNTRTGIDMQTLAGQALHGQPVLQPPSAACDRSQSAKRVCRIFEELKLL